jgi:hypothetical protein
MAASKLKPLTIYRQSTLAGFETCARRTEKALELGDDFGPTGWVGSSGELGTVMHAVLAELLRTLYRTGEIQAPTQEAVEITYEVYRGMDIVLPAEDRRALVQMVLGFCRLKWEPHNILALEERLTLEVECPDGKSRVLKGQPDIIIADPPHGLIVGDWKSGMGQPREPRDKSKIIQQPDGIELVTGLPYLSERGHFQLDTYGVLALLGRKDDGSMIAPTAEYVTLREYHLRSGKVREATLSREEATEHPLRMLGVHMMKLDQAISEGAKSKLWTPRPGSHCLKQCPVARSCPVPKEMRGTGALETQADADREAKLFVRGKAMHEQARERTKAWQEQGNPAARVNEREELRWGPDVDAWMTSGGGRKYDVWPVDMNGNGNGAGDGGS